MSSLTLPEEILSIIQPAIPIERQVYLVGGAVRDALIGRIAVDLDFTVSDRAIDTARRVADNLKAAFYPLDTSRDIGRVIIKDWEGKRLTLDFAAFQGEDLIADLQNRDFTINAMALSTRELDRLIDPLGGAKDLVDKKLHPCSDDSFESDPIRILRAFRLASDLNLKFSPQAKSGIHQAIPALKSVSMERLRDELFRILEGAHSITVLRALDIVGALNSIYPELEELKTIPATPPHTLDAFSHSMDTAQRMLQIMDVLSVHQDTQIHAGWVMGMISLKLGRYRRHLSDHFLSKQVTGRSPFGLTLMAALYHDTGEPFTHGRDADDNLSNNLPEHAGAQIAYKRACELKLSRWECDRISRIVKNHLLPIHLAQSGDKLSRRQIYRFFRASSDAGVDICLLSLADTLATYGTDLPHQKWINLLGVVRSLLEGWWEQTDQVISPPILINGTDLMELFQLKPGAHIGRILNSIQEAQASGEIETRDQAFEFARGRINQYISDENGSFGSGN